MHKIELSEQESILYFYIKTHGWSRQRDLIQYRGKDDKQTRRLLNGMVNKRILINKYQLYYNGVNTMKEKYYNLKH